MHSPRRWEAAIRRVGQRAEWEQDGVVFSLPVSIQPQSSAKQALQGDALGLYSGTAGYTLYAPVGTLVPRVGDCVSSRGRQYRVQQTETFSLAGSALYHWALLEEVMQI